MANKAVRALQSSILIYSGKPKWDQLVSRRLAIKLAERKLNSLVINTGFIDDGRALDKLDDPTEKPVLAIVKPTRDAGRIKVAMRARELSISTIIWSRYIYYKQWSNDISAMFVPIRQETSDSVNHLTDLAVFSVQTWLDGHSDIKNEPTNIPA